MVFFVERKTSTKSSACVCVCVLFCCDPHLKILVEGSITGGVFFPIFWWTRHSDVSRKCETRDHQTIFFLSVKIPWKMSFFSAMAAFSWISAIWARISAD